MSPGRVLGSTTMRAFLPPALLLAFAAALAPSAFAQEDAVSARPDDAAWVEDCPPDAMCAMDAPPEADRQASSAAPAASIAAALGILAVAGIGVALLPRA